MYLVIEYDPYPDFSCVIADARRQAGELASTGSRLACAGHWDEANRLVREASNILERINDGRLLEDYVALETTLYDDAGKIVDSLSNSIFYAQDTDWCLGRFERVEDIPERCEHLRAVAADLIAAHTRSLAGKREDQLVELLCLLEPDAIRRAFKRASPAGVFKLIDEG